MREIRPRPTHGPHLALGKERAVEALEAHDAHAALGLDDGLARPHVVAQVPVGRLVALGPRARRHLVHKALADGRPRLLERHLRRDPDAADRNLRSGHAEFRLGPTVCFSHVEVRACRHGLRRLVILTRMSLFSTGNAPALRKEKMIR